VLKKRKVHIVDISTAEKRREDMQFGSLTDEEGGFKFWEDVKEFKEMLVSEGCMSDCEFFMCRSPECKMCPIYRRAASRLHE